MSGKLIVDGRERDVGDGELTAMWNEYVRPPKRHVVVTGNHDVVDPGLDVVGFRKGTQFEFTGTLAAKMSSAYAALDMSDSSGCVMRGLRLAGDEDEMPNVGWLVSRVAEQNHRSAASHRLFDCQFVGRWRTAAVYLIGSEEQRWYGCRIDNKNNCGACGLYLGRYNRHGVVSHWGVTPDNDRTATAFAAHGLAMNTTTPHAIVVAGHSKACFTDCYVSSKSGTYLFLDVSRQSVSGLELRGFQGQGNPDYGIDIDGAFGHGIVGVRIEARQLASKVAPVHVGRCDVTHMLVDHYEPNPVAVDAEARLSGCAERGRQDPLPRSIDQVP